MGSEEGGWNDHRLFEHRDLASALAWVFEVKAILEMPAADCGCHAICG